MTSDRFHLALQVGFIAHIGCTTGLLCRYLDLEPAYTTWVHRSRHVGIGPCVVVRRSMAVGGRGEGGRGGHNSDMFT